MCTKIIDTIKVQCEGGSRGVNGIEGWRELISEEAGANIVEMLPNKGGFS